MAFKEARGILSLVLMVLAYGIYIWQTMREDGVRPHPFSWFLWGFVTGVVYRRHGDTETRRKAKANHKGHKGRRRAIARNAKIPKKSKTQNL
jgi:hypothetical protein